jgi:peptide/nickel transport system substrate-binding protein
VGIVVLVSACRPGAEPSSQASVAAPGAAAQPAAPKILTMGIGREPSVFSNDLITSAEAAGGLTPLKQVPHNYLMVQNDRFAWVPQLAAEAISAERGTWKVNPDGTMETTWKLHPNVKWHDGAPFTAADLVFSLSVYKDSELPNRSRGAARFMQSASAPDPLTFVVQWSEVFAFADQATSLEPLPWHLLEEVYLNDKANFTNSPYLRAEFVGLGPYRLTKWEPGSHLEFSRFDDYYRGRPPLDQVIARVTPDSNAMVANLLAGTVDVLIDVNVALDTAVEIRQRWEGTGNRVFFVSSGGVRWLEMQLRPEYARPLNGFIHPAVRQAFAHGTNRDQLNEIMTYGFSEVADSWIARNDERRPQVEDAIRQWPYDPARAQQLLAQAGWARGSDGVLVHQPSGERFELEIRATQAGDSQKFLNVLGDDWKALGVQPTLYEIPAALTSNNEFRATLSGITHVSGAVNNASRFHSRNNASAENRWVGVRGGYVNPRQDALADRVDTAITAADRVSSLRELLQEVTTNLPLIPLYWGIDSGFTVAGVTGVTTSSAWNAAEWDKR